MAAPIIYRSTDASAPVLTGVAGDLVNLLDKCLVVGYGAKAAAGWTKPYIGTSKAAFRQGGGNQFYLRVQDDGPGVGTGREARVFGYEVMTTVDAGTGLFPTTAQMATGLFCRKSPTADATARAWIVIADDRTFYLFVLTTDTTNAYYCFAFGDFYSYLNGDAYRTMIIARSVENSAVATYDRLDYLNTGVTAAAVGHYFARCFNGAGASVNFGKCGDYAKGQSSYPLGVVAYPNPTDGSLYLAAVEINDPSTAPYPSVRGKMRGFYHLCHPVANFADGDTFTGTGLWAGKSFLLIKNSANGGLFCIETTAWDTSS